MKGTIADQAPVVPISAQLGYNIDALVEFIVTKIPVPIRDFTSSPRLIVIRSFDVNKPGADVQDLKGGVAGGSLLKGVLRVCHILLSSSFDSLMNNALFNSLDKRLRLGQELLPRTLRDGFNANPSEAKLCPFLLRRISSSLLSLEG